MNAEYVRLLTVVFALVLLAASCGDSSDDNEGASGSDADVESSDGESGDPEEGDPEDGDPSDGETEAGETETGDTADEGPSEFVDLGTFLGDPPQHLDPALNSTVGAYQVINAVYDGLTEIDASDPANPTIVPLVAESYEPNADATVWTFTIREDAAFSNGEAITASTFKRSWERAAALQGFYSFLLTFLEGGDAALDSGGEISGVVADDDARTLEVTLSAPNSEFDAVAGFQLFFPMPEEALEAGAEYENGVMIGNGPYAMESARTDEEITLVRSDSWVGDFNGETWDDRVDRIVFRTQSDPETGYLAFEAGEGDSANIPPGRTADAQANWGTTLDVGILGSYFFAINDRSDVIGGADNLLLRQAVSAAIDRDEINEAVFSGSRATATGITPPGIPGQTLGLCEFCAFDPDQAQALFDEWVADGGSLEDPLPLQFASDSGEEPVIQIVIDNLADIGIEAEAQPFPPETYFDELASGGCVICLAGWFADYPTYDNFMFNLFHGAALDGTNLGFINDDFDALVDEALSTPDSDAAAALFQDAERIVLNEQTMTVPINWYRGDYVYNDDEIATFPQTSLGLILWEQVAFK